MAGNSCISQEASMDERRGSVAFAFASRHGVREPAIWPDQRCYFRPGVKPHRWVKPRTSQECGERPELEVETTDIGTGGLLLTLALAGCGSGGGGGGGTDAPSNPGTPAGTYPLTVTGTTGSGSSALSHSATLTLTVS